MERTPIVGLSQLASAAASSSRLGQVTIVFVVWENLEEGGGRGRRDGGVPKVYSGLDPTRQDQDFKLLILELVYLFLAVQNSSGTHSEKNYGIIWEFFP